MTNATTAMFNADAAGYSRRRLVPCFDAFDGAPAMIAIHHLDDPSKADLYARAHDALRPGGAFINAEQVLGETPAIDALLWRWHEREARALGATDEEWAAAVDRMKHDRCATAATNLELLRAAGFQDVSVHFADGRFAVLAGRRAA